MFEGFLELGEELPSRLQAYLSSFDAVVLGDGSLQFARGLAEDLLGLPRSPSAAQLKDRDRDREAAGGGVGGLLRKGLLGKFLGGGGGGGAGGSGWGEDSSPSPPPPSPPQPSYPSYADSRQQQQQFGQGGPSRSQQPQRQEYAGEQKSYLHYGDY